MVTEHRFASPQTNVTKKPGTYHTLRLHTIAYQIGNCFQPRTEKAHFGRATPEISPEARDDEPDRWYASSKLCARCGWQNDVLKLSDREWRCGGCGVLNERDLNAAVNLRAGRG